MVILRRLAEEGNRMLLHDPSVRNHRLVLERYPKGLPLEAFEAHPGVLSDMRLRAKRNRELTRQVFIVHQGHLLPG